MTDKAQLPHFRHFRSLAEDGESVECKSGATVAIVETDTGIIAGASYCNPIDNFDRSKGRLIATNRLKLVIADKELSNDDKYFVREGKLDDFLRVLTDYMADLGYVPAGPRRK